MAESEGLLQSLQNELAKLPGIGPKSAERIVNFLVSGEKKVAQNLASILHQVVLQVKPCQRCYNLSEKEMCALCTDTRRDDSQLCVVESPRDVNLFERTGTFRGRYHVLGGRLAPLEGVGPEKLTLNQLVRRVREEKIEEVILATSPTLDGDGTALFAAHLLTGMPVKITKLARGIPTGASLELANTQILSEAMQGRKTME